MNYRLSILTPWLLPTALVLPSCQAMMDAVDDLQAGTEKMLKTATTTHKAAADVHKTIQIGEDVDDMIEREGAYAGHPRAASHRASRATVPPRQRVRRPGSVDTEPNDALAQACLVSLTPGRVVSLEGELGYDGDAVDYYAFTAPVKGKLSFVLHNTTDNPSRLAQAELLDSSSEVLVKTEYAGNGGVGAGSSRKSSHKELLVAGREYFLELRYTKGSYANYRVELTFDASH